MIVMIYHYQCTDCGLRCSRDWMRRDEAEACAQCGHVAPAPNPRAQPDAWVDGETVPNEMRVEVIRTNGGKCAVPWCVEPAQGAGSRIASNEGGRTCISNLVALCGAHARVRGKGDYGVWIQNLAFEHLARPRLV